MGGVPLYVRGDDAHARQFRSLHAVQRHMVDTCQCKMAYDDNEEEYEEFYDYDMAQVRPFLDTVNIDPGANDLMPRGLARALSGWCCAHVGMCVEDARLESWPQFSCPPASRCELCRPQLVMVCSTLVCAEEEPPHLQFDRSSTGRGRRVAPPDRFVFRIRITVHERKEVCANHERYCGVQPALPAPVRVSY
jgi:hypothetical protein